ncbi:DUF1441 family protein [Mesorhizobium sp. M7A.F.Ca.ET.027.03.2.1]|uniref:DUF1441 family protein n=1 Tax=Mesorhizobium sp. M7A.F.Ca.ET.027.03.2.1 TaxID=2496656 RepID=UPI002478C0D0|nr:DUF1441 family protein [Mesorhizobium sp. M7A.F.Ca.ET.027.03.2.1]
MSDSTRFPLPQGVADGVLNKGQLARALGKTEPTIDRWMQEGMPILDEGSNGKAYAFQLSQCFAWMQERDETSKHQEEAQERIVRQMQLALIGGKEGDTERSLPPSERMKVYEAESKWQELALRRGELVEASTVLDLVETIFGLMRQGIETLPDTLARECGMDGAQTERAVRAGDDILQEIARAVDAFADDLAKRETPAVPEMALT